MTLRPHPASTNPHAGLAERRRPCQDLHPPKFFGACIAVFAYAPCSDLRAQQHPFIVEQRAAESSLQCRLCLVGTLRISHGRHRGALSACSLPSSVTPWELTSYAIRNGCEATPRPSTACCPSFLPNTTTERIQVYVSVDLQHGRLRAAHCFFSKEADHESCNRTNGSGKSRRRNKPEMPNWQSWTPTPQSPPKT